MRSQVAPSRARGLKHAIRLHLSTAIHLAVAPSRARGLKLELTESERPVPVAPSRARGLKRHRCGLVYQPQVVAPSRARGLKQSQSLVYLTVESCGGSRALTGAWIETFSLVESKRYVFAKSRPHGRVD